MADRPPLLVRRLRALLRRPRDLGRDLFRTLDRRLRPSSPRPIEGFVDGCVGGEIRGWAMYPGQPQRRVHVLAISDGRVVAETLADISRADLVQAGLGDGRHAFRLKLPPDLLEGGRRTVEVQAVLPGPPVGLLRGRIEIDAIQDGPSSTGVRAGARAIAAADIQDEPPPAVIQALWPGAGEPDGDGFPVVRLGAGPIAAAELSSAHTVIFAHPEDRLDPALADLLSSSRPLADVITWDGPDAVSRRPEARALGLRLGESLDGRFAIRGHVLNLVGAPLLQALAAGDPRRAEQILAGREDIRWIHLPARLTRYAAAPSERPSAAAAQARVDRISVAVWPAWSPSAAASLRTLIAGAGPEAELELLVHGPGAEDARLLAQALDRQVTVRAVDAPAAGTVAGWLASYAAAASGEVVILCQAGVTLGGAPGTLDRIAGWAAAPGVATVTVPIRHPGGVLAGLALARSDAGWAATSAFAPELAGLDRPVLAAPAAFLAIGRDRLASLGGPADGRLPAGGAELDLALRLRRIGLFGVLLGELDAEAVAETPLAGELSGAPLAAFDPAELAAAAAAWPAPQAR